MATATLTRQITVKHPVNSCYTVRIPNTTLSLVKDSLSSLYIEFIEELGDKIFIMGAEGKTDTSTKIMHLLSFYNIEPDYECDIVQTTLEDGPTGNSITVSVTYRK